MGYYLADRASDYAYIAFFPLAWLVFCNTDLSRRLAPIQLLSSQAHRRLIAIITGLYLAWFASYGLISSALALSQTDANHARSLIQQQIQVDAKNHGEDPSEAGVAKAFKFMHTPSFIALGTPFEEKGVTYVDSDGVDQAVCGGDEMKSFEDQFNVDPGDSRAWRATRCIDTGVGMIDAVIPDLPAIKESYRVCSAP
jgi:hypothetical protein